jgi:cytochrome b561
VPEKTTAVLPYTIVACALHWLSAVLIICSFALAFYMVDLPVSPGKVKLFSWHKWLGITVLGVVSLRLLWRLCYPPPRQDPRVPAWQQRIANGLFLVFYILLFTIPITGWVYSSAAGYPVVYLGIKSLRLPDLVGKDRELAALLKQIHGVANWTLLGLVIVHAGAALKHHFYDRDGVLHRMLPILSTLEAKKVQGRL